MEDERTETAEQPEANGETATLDPIELQKQRDEYYDQLVAGTPLMRPLRAAQRYFVDGRAESPIYLDAGSGTYLDTV